MSTFRFEAGNLRALRNLPFYLLGALASALVPRTPRLWVFGSGIGLGEGALPLYRLARQRLGADVRLVWLTTTARELAEARDAHLDAVPKAGARGLWLTLRARVVVVTHGMGDVNRFGVRGGFVVQLWHGIPLKRLHLDSPVALRLGPLPVTVARWVMSAAYRRVGRAIQLFPVSSGRVVTRVSTAFGIPPDRIAVTGDPRDDVLLQGDPAQRRERARERLAGLVGELPATVVLHAPTWRDGEVDPAVPDDATWDEIVGWLDRHDAALVVRSHPLAHGDYSAGARRSSRVRLLPAGLLADVTPVLPAVDAVVTDYSSIAFDYSLVGGPVVFLAPDVVRYTRTRGFYESYRQVTGGRAVLTWRETLAELDSGLAGDPQVRARVEWLRTEFFDRPDGRATERVLDEILRRTAGDAASTPAEPVRRPGVTSVRVDGDRLRVVLDCPVPAVRLAGPRGSVDGELSGSVATFPLLVTRWRTPGLALPTGDYRLTIGGDRPTTRVAVTQVTHVDTLHELYRVRTLAAEGGLVVRIGPPLRDGERGRHPAARQWLVALRPRRGLENAVYFESFYGRTVGCNPRAIDRVLAAAHPDVRRYWSVADGSVAVPEGAVRIVEGSPEWWRVRAEVRVFVVNDWLRWTFRRRRGQHVLQTWHGSMLKRLGRDRPGVSSRRRFAILRQQLRWSAILAQNTLSVRTFRTSYGFRGPIWETGYPRNDILHDPSRAQAVRATIGVPEHARLVLYTPTWREDRDEMVDLLDLAVFADRLPPDTVLLVRGHSRTLAFGQDLRADRLVDVTTYPDVADLMLVADVLVTDYSSVMFDFVTTDKPMVFYVPDLAHYGDVLRGFYFDLIAEAPGPVVETADGLLEAIRDIDASQQKYAEARAAWRERFAPHDDGHAAERVVARMYAAGWLG
jgi:CDP-glycerol glycerophosphotransferase